jgi:hypothetical protein
MGHQADFFVLPDDLPVIETAIRSAGDVYFLEDRTPTDRPVVTKIIAITWAGGTTRLRCFGAARFAGQIRATGADIRIRSLLTSRWIRSIIVANK